MIDRPTIRIALADDHRMVRLGLTALIDGFDDLELIGEAADGLEAISLCAEHLPDVLLMDMLMPKMDGIEAIQTIHRDYPQVRIIALTSFKDGDLVQSALKAGALGYVLKSASIDELVEAIRAAVDNKPTLAWEAAQALIDISMRPTQPDYDLTERELEVIMLMVDGQTNRQIAEQLDISHYTVNAHVRNILSKLNAGSRTEAVALALQHRLVDRD